MQDLRKSIFSGIVGVGILAAAGFAAASYFIPDTVRTVIIGTEVYGDRDLVLTEAGTFQNTAAWYRLKVRTSKLQRKIGALKGKKVDIKKYGWRVGPYRAGNLAELAWYENIVGVEEVKE